MSKDILRVSKQVLFKSYREQDKGLFAQSLWRYIQKVCEDNKFRDGFVEWSVAKELIKDTLKEMLQNHPEINNLYSCETCGERFDRDQEQCPICGGEVISND